MPPPARPVARRYSRPSEYRASWSSHPTGPAAGRSGCGWWVRRPAGPPAAAPGAGSPPSPAQPAASTPAGARVRSDQVRVGTGRVGQVGSGRVGSGQVRSGQVRSGRVGSLHRVGVKSRVQNQLGYEDHVSWIDSIDG